jgi:hypothetical protein
MILNDFEIDRAMLGTGQCEYNKKHWTAGNNCYVTTCGGSEVSNGSQSK